MRLYYTAQKRGGPLCVAVATAETPAGPWTDGGPLVCQADGSLDAFFVRDDKGHGYSALEEKRQRRQLRVHHLCAAHHRRWHARDGQPARVDPE